MTDETNNNTQQQLQQQQPSTDQKPQSTNKPLNEQLIKSAVSFLSSPNVQSAETVKKVAFLQKKGLSAEEIQEAFKRVDQAPPSVPTASVTTSSPAVAAASTTVVAPPAPLIPKRTAYHQQQPSIIYQPLPPTPPMQLQRLIAIALIFGVGAVGFTSGIVGIVKRLLLPTFNGVTTYQMGRYKHQKSVLDKLGGQLAGESTVDEEEHEVQEENSNDKKEKKDKEGKEESKKQEQDKNRVDLSKELAEKQAALADRLAHMVSRARARHLESKDNVDLYTDFNSSVVDLRNTINKPEYMQTPSLYNSMAGMGLGVSNESSTAVHGLKSEIRSLKGILLNRRRIN